VGPFKAALGTFYTGNVLPFVVGAFGEVNEDASRLITKLAHPTAKTPYSFGDKCRWPIRSVSFGHFQSIIGV